MSSSRVATYRWFPLQQLQLTVVPYKSCNWLVVSPATVAIYWRFPLKLPLLEVPKREVEEPFSRQPTEPLNKWEMESFRRFARVKDQQLAQIETKIMRAPTQGNEQGM